MIKVSILTQEDQFFIPKNIQKLIDSEYIEVKSIVIINSSGSLNNKKLFFLKNFIFAGAVRLAIKSMFYRILDFINLITFNLFSNKVYSILALAKKNSIEINSIVNPNDKVFLKKLKNLKLDFIISYSAPVVFKSELLAIPKFHCINLHCSYLPKYSGILPSFWVLYNLESKTGCTVHLMDDKIDNGQIVLQKEVSIKDVNSIFEVNRITKEEGGKLMLKSIIGLYNKTIMISKNEVQKKNYNSWPNENQIKNFIRNGKKIY